MIRTLLATGLLLAPLALLSVMLVGCQQADDTPPPETQTAAPGQSQIDALVISYLGLRDALAQDQSEGLRDQFAAVRRAAQTLTHSENAQIRARAETIVEQTSTEPENLKQAREMFEDVSAATIEIVAIEPPSDEAAQSLYVAYCPMAEARWLQTSQELSNPYMGQKMPNCGEIQEAVKPATA